MIDYPWYGNVRELENAVEFMINMADDSGIVTMDMLPANIVENKNFQGHGMNIDEDIRPLKDVEKDYILRALDIYGHDTKGKRLAAERLGIGIATLYRKLEGIKIYQSDKFLIFIIPKYSKNLYFTVMIINYCFGNKTI